MNRGGLNIDYADGFKLEEQGFKRYYKAIKHVLNATEIESTARTMIDKATGVDLNANQLVGKEMVFVLKYVPNLYHSRSRALVMSNLLPQKKIPNNHLHHQHPRCSNLD